MNDTATHPPSSATTCSKVFPTINPEKRRTNTLARVNEYLLGVDMGTGSTKGVLARPEGSVVATAARTHAMSLPRSGWAEMDAEVDWWQDVVEVVNELAGQATDGQVAGLCVCGLGPCLLVADADSRPLRQGILYGIDTRATAEISELNRRYGERAIQERCGKALTSQAVGPKLLWVRHHEPEVWKRTRRWYSSHSYVVARLTGEYVLDHHTASQCDPMYDLAANDWNHDWAEELAPGLELPRLAWPGEVVGTLHAEAATACGLPKGLPVCAGTIDALGEALSAGVRGSGDLMLMYGSTLFFIGALDQMQTHPRLWTTAGVEPGSYALAAGMATSGSLTTWVQGLTGGAPFDQLVDEAASTKAGADGLLVLPYFAGERAPIFDPAARGVVAGLTLRHGRGHLLRAAYEGIAFGARHILESFDEAAGFPRRLVGVGGGTQGGLWPQIVTDVTGRLQQLPVQTIGASYGGAQLAGIGAGLVAADAQWAEVATELEPDLEHRALYDELYATYRELYPATLPSVHRLAELQNETPKGSRALV